MKRNLILLFFCSLFITYNGKAQITNGGFENWEASGNPTSWLVTNAPPSYTTVVKSSDSHSGSWAARGDVVTFSVFTISPSLISGTDGSGFPINFRPVAFSGYYKFDSVSDDFLEVQANFLQNGVGVGVGAAFLSPAASYTQFNVPINYLNSLVPDTVLIAIFVGNTNGFGHVGSKIFIDDLAWSNTTDVNEFISTTPDRINLFQNYPNPFNPSTVISYQLPMNGDVTLKVYDLLGKEVATLVNEYKPAGRYEVKFDASGISSGMYFYTIQNGSYIETKKMILLR